MSEEQTPTRETLVTHSRLFGPGLLSLVFLAGCPTPSSHYEIDVGPDQVLAADVLPGQFDYWVLDASGNIVDDGSLTFTGTAPSVTVNSDQAAGLYVTTPDYDTPPGYTVAFEGDVKDDAVFSYLDTDEDGFVDIRGNDPAAMFSKHQDMVAAGTQIRANWELDAGLQADALTTLAHDEVTGSQSDLQTGISILLDSDDLEAAEDGTSGIASWATGVQDELGLIEGQALADSDAAAVEATDLEALAPDPATLQQAIEDCLELEEWGDELEQALDKAYPDKEGDTYDGKTDDGDLDRDWAETEAALEQALENQEAVAADIELCVELAIGGEPAVSYTETDETPYVTIGDNATAYAEAAAADADAYLADLETTYADSLGGDELSAWGALGWMAPADAATALIEAEVGSDMFTPPTTGAGVYVDSLTATMKSDSSATACENTTTVFQINLLGLGVAVGTPFDDTIRGGDVESSFEVIWGGQGDDCINGLKGHEILLGGPGNDEIHGGDQHELIVGGDGDDAIFAGYGDDYDITIGAVTVGLELGSVIFGGEGDDVISGSDPDYDENDASDFGYTDLIFGDGLTESTAGEDTIDGGGGIDFLFGQWSDDVMRNRREGRIVINGVEWGIGSFHFGGKGDDDMVGSDRFDLMIGSDGADTISSEDGLDIIIGGDGSDTLDGGGSVDLVFAMEGDDTASGGDGIDLVMGGSGDDTVSGGDGLLDLLFGGSGDDSVNGEGGFDVAFGGSGRDTVDGGDDLDLLFGGSDNDTVMGRDGIDLAFGGSGRDRVEGGDGAVDLRFGNDETDIVVGQAGLDVIFGNDGDDWMDGEDGIDLAFGGDGDDVVFGGDDLDLLFANDGDDCVWGEQGIDFGFGGDGDDQLVGGTELDLLVGSAGEDLLHGDEGIDILLGGDDADAISGGADLGLLFGGGDDDQLEGGDTMDLFFGGDGSDCQTGDDGFDIAFGGEDDDVSRDVGVGFGNDGADEIETSLVGLGGDGDDVIAQVGTSMAFLLGSGGADALVVDEAGAIAFVFGGDDDDTISATGSTPTSSGSTTRAFVFGGKDADWIQASRGKSFAFGQKGDDTMSGDMDGTSTNDDQKDRHWGNSDSDTMFGDDDNKQDKLYRGSGSDPSRSWDDWPTTSPGWGSSHAPVSFATCTLVPDPSECEELMEPPQDVGAK